MVHSSGGGVKGIIPYKTCVYKLKSRCKGKNLIKILSLSRIKGCSLNVSGKLNKLTLSGKIINSSILIDGNGNFVTMVKKYRYKEFPYCCKRRWH